MMSKTNYIFRKFKERDAKYIPKQLQTRLMEARESPDVVIDS